jgi:hypothetical protein
MPIDAALTHDQWLRYVYIRDNGHLDYLVKANKCDQFYLGHQWDPVVKKQLDSQRRPALTINKILATVSNIQGDQIQTRAEVTFKPLHVSGEDLSNELSVLAKQTSGANRLEWKEGEVFADGVITSRGFFDVRLDFKRNMQGEIAITVPNPRNVLIDPDGEEYDPDTWKDVIYTKWLSPQDIATLYNQADADYLEFNNTNPYTNDIDSIQKAFDTFGGQSHYYTFNAVARKVVRNIRVLERQYKKLTKCKYFVDKQIGDIRLIPENWDRDRIAYVAQTYNLGVIEKVEERIRWTVTAGQCRLHDAWSPFKHFSFVPFFPHFRRGNTMGIVENLLDPQELLNKVSSQELHIVNTTANSGWKVKRNSLRNMTIEELETRGAQTGVIIEVDDPDKDLIKIEPNQIPTGIERISYKAEEHIKSISNIDDNALGQDREDVSAKAIKAKRARGSVNQLKVMENLNYTRLLMWRNILDIYQEYYTEPRMYRIVYGTPTAQAAQSADASGQSQPPEEFLSLNQFDTASGKIMNDLSLGEYDTIITSMPAADTLEESEFEQVMAMREAGIVIPDDVVISHSLLRNKRELVQRLTAQANSPEAQQQKQLALQGQTAGVDKLTAEAKETNANALLKAASAQEKVAGMVSAAPLQPGSEGSDLASQILQNRHEAAAQASEQQHEATTQAADQAHEAGMAAASRAHDVGMAAVDHETSVEQAAQNAKHEKVKQETATKGAIRVARARPKPTTKGKK